MENNIFGQRLDVCLDSSSELTVKRFYFNSFTSGLVIKYQKDNLEYKKYI